MVIRLISKYLANYSPPQEFNFIEYARRSTATGVHPGPMPAFSLMLVVWLSCYLRFRNNNIPPITKSDIVAGSGMQMVATSTESM
jgi:hypothetical protein